MPRGQPAPVREGLSYPLYRTNDRPLPADYSGSLHLWDIDNTYLMTEWSSLYDLIRIRFEAAADKKPIPGAVALLRALRRGASDPLRVPVYFVSASPETMRRTLEKRMLLDGVEQDGATFRDLWTSGRPHIRHLRDVYGYKIAALLLYRLENPPGAREVLYGDDREHDPEVYALYARVCGGRLRGDAFEAILLARGVRKNDARYMRLLADALPERDPVERIVIRRTGLSRAEGAAKPPFDAVDARILRVDDYAQAAVALRAFDRIGAEGLAAVVSAVRAEGIDGDLEAPLAALGEAVTEERARGVRGEIALLEVGRPIRYGPPAPPAAAPPVELPLPDEVVAELAAEESAECDLTGSSEAGEGEGK